MIKESSIIMGILKSKDMKPKKQLKTDQYTKELKEIAKYSFEQGFIAAVRITNGKEPKYKNVDEYLKLLDLK